MAGGTQAAAHSHPQDSHASTGPRGAACESGGESTRSGESLSVSREQVCVYVYFFLFIWLCITPSLTPLPNTTPTPRQRNNVTTAGLPSVHTEVSGWGGHDNEENMQYVFLSFSLSLSMCVCVCVAFPH